MDSGGQYQQDSSSCILINVGLKHGLNRKHICSIRLKKNIDLNYGQICFCVRLCWLVCRVGKLLWLKWHYVCWLWSRDAVQIRCRGKVTRCARVCLFDVRDSKASLSMPIQLALLAHIQHFHLILCSHLITFCCDLLLFVVWGFWEGVVTFLMIYCEQ